MYFVHGEYPKVSLDKRCFHFAVSWGGVSCSFSIFFFMHGNKHSQLFVCSTLLFWVRFPLQSFLPWEKLRITGRARFPTLENATWYVQRADVWVFDTSVSCSFRETSFLFQNSYAGWKKEAKARCLKTNLFFHHHLHRNRKLRNDWKIGLRIAIESSWKASKTKRPPNKGGRKTDYEKTK